MAIVVENHGFTGATSGAASFEVPVGTNKLIVFALRSSTAVGGISGIDHNGDALSFLSGSGITSSSFPEAATEVWYRDNPTAQIATLTQTGPSQYHGWVAYALSGVDLGTTPIIAKGGDTAEVTVDITTDVADMLVLGGHALGRDDTVTQSISSPWTQDRSFTLNGGSATYRGKGGGAHRFVASPATVTLDWALTGTPNRMTMVALALAPSSAPAAEGRSRIINVNQAVHRAAHW